MMQSYNCLPCVNKIPSLKYNRANAKILNIIHYIFTCCINANGIDVEFLGVDNYPLEQQNSKLGCLLSADDVSILSESKGGLQEKIPKVSSEAVNWRKQANGQNEKEQEDKQ